MATRWTRLNPLNWLTRRGSTRVAPQPEYTVPPAYQTSPQDDYSAADRPALTAPGLEYFAEHGDEDDEIFDQNIVPTVTLNPYRPRTLDASYNANTQTLRVTYRGGVAYDYPGVEPEQWASLQRERTSTGKWLARNGLGGPGSGIRV